MKLKYILPFIAGALLTTACEKDHRNDNLVDPLVYIVNNGHRTATYYDVEETTDFNIYAYSSGYFGAASDVSVELAPEIVEEYNLANGTAFQLLDPLCYEIVKDSGSITAEGRRATMVVRLKCTEIMKLPMMNDYLIPLHLSATGTEVNEEMSTILINPKMQETEVLAKNAGVVECDLSAEGDSSLEFTLYTEFANKWDSENEYAHGSEVLAAYNAEHGTNYIPLPEEAYTFTPANLKAGQEEAVSHIEIDKTLLAPDRFYTLAVKIAGNSKFKVGADNTVLYHISLLPIRDERSKWKLVLCSSYQNGGGPERMIDGDPATRWENRYNSSGSGDQGKLPIETIWDMGKSYYWCGMTIGRRTDQSSKYVTDLRAGYVDLSNDGDSWTRVQDFDFGDKTNTAPSVTFVDEQWKTSGRYVRLTITESNRGTNVSVTEFEPALAQMPE